MLSATIECEDLNVAYPHIFDLCDRYDDVTNETGLDLDLGVYDALFSLIDGGAVEEALGFIPHAHPGAAEVCGHIRKVGDAYLEVMTATVDAAYVAAIGAIDEGAALGDALEMVPDDYPNADEVRAKVAEYWLKVYNL